jgi:hypothetical protein
MPQSGFETAIPPSEQSQTYALDRAAIGIGFRICNNYFFSTATIVERTRFIVKLYVRVYCLSVHSVLGYISLFFDAGKCMAEKKLWNP